MSGNFAEKTGSGIRKEEINVKTSEVVTETKRCKNSDVVSTYTRTPAEIDKRDCALLSISKAVEKSCEQRHWKISFDVIKSNLKTQYRRVWEAKYKQNHHETQPHPVILPRCECTFDTFDTCDLDRRMMHSINEAIRHEKHVKSPGRDIGYTPILFDGSFISGYDDANHPDQIRVEVRHECHGKFDEYIDEHRFVLEEVQSPVNHCYHVLYKIVNASKSTYHCEDLQQIRPRMQYIHIDQNGDCWLWMVSIESWDFKGDCTRQDLQSSSGSESMEAN